MQRNSLGSLTRQPPDVPRRDPRKGAVAVEFALVAPFVVLLLLGSIEVGRAVMAQHMLQEAAQAGCRLYSMEDVTQAQADAIIAVAMEHAGIDQYEVEYLPASKAEIVSPLQPVSAVVTANYEEVGWLAPFHMGGAKLVGRCTMPADVADDYNEDDNNDDEADSQNADEGDPSRNRWRRRRNR